MTEELMRQLMDLVGEEYFKLNEPMKDHITFQVGGPADYYIAPGDKDTLRDVLSVCRRQDIPFYIIGNGSNLIVRDKGYRGAIIDLSRMDMIYTKGCCITAQCGAMMKDVARAALEAELTGFEFASGIPGSIGGGARMNAGAYDGELKDIVKNIYVLDENGEELVLSNADCNFSYRHSIVQEHPYVVEAVELELRPGSAKEIQEKMDDLNARRAAKQPLEYPSAGSTFRRPEGYFAGKLIQDIGFKGKCCGGAQVSEKHSGFVINKGGATAEDILTLIGMIQAEIKKQFGIDIKTEVIVIGE